VEPVYQWRHYETTQPHSGYLEVLRLIKMSEDRWLIILKKVCGIMCDTLLFFFCFYFRSTPLTPAYYGHVSTPHDGTFTKISVWKHSLRQNIAVGSPPLLCHISEFLRSYLGWETGFTEMFVVLLSHFHASTGVISQIMMRPLLFATFPISHLSACYMTICVPSHKKLRYISHK
jgi:hypothetical protein